MKLLALPRYSRNGASSRLRTLQYLPIWRKSGIDADVSPLFGEKYITNLYQRKLNVWQVFKAYLRRIWRMFNAGGYDIVYVEKELLPWLPASLELLLLSRKAKLVLDFDDAIFHRYDESRSALIRKLLGRKIDRLMRRADLVIAGNEYLADRAKKAGCKWVEIVPTVVDLERYPLKSDICDGSAMNIGWIGSPSTAQYLKLVSDSAQLAMKQCQVSFSAIGARQDQLRGTPFQAVVWSEDSEVIELSKLNVGIMPLRDESWERGKCGYKLVQYMACGLPVIASPVGVNVQMVMHGKNGFLCNTEEQWQTAFVQLAQDSRLRAELGHHGRRLVETQYCLQVQGPRLLVFFLALQEQR